jgi:hypothetical protein
MLKNRPTFFPSPSRHIGVVALPMLTSLLASAQIAAYEPALIDGVDRDTSALNAGQYMEAGTVRVCQNGHVTFTANEGWLTSEVHLHSASSPDQIPPKNGNPHPGKFTYKGEFYPAVCSYKHEVDPITNTTYVAASSAWPNHATART